MTCYAFADFEFDTVSGELTRGGERLSLRPQPAALLALLLDRRDRVVSKEEILDSIWHDAIVQDQSLFQCIAELRKSLGDAAREPRFVKTVARKGYRWIGQETREVRRGPVPPPAPLTTPGPAAASGSSQAGTASTCDNEAAPRSTLVSWLKRSLRPVLVGLILLGVPATGWWAMRDRDVERAPGSEPLLAVLPVDNATGEEDFDWVTYGLMDLISRSLARDKGVRTLGVDEIARVEARLGEGRGEDEWLRALSQDLGADWLVRTRLERVDGQTALAYTLFNRGGVARTDTLYGDGPIVLARMLVASLAATLGSGPPRVVGGTVDPFLEELYAKGIHQLYRGGARQARAYFQVCLDNDPDFLRAKLQLAICCEKLTEYEDSERLGREVLEAARSNGDPALEGGALNNLGTLAFHRQDWEAATQVYQQALRAFEAAGDPKGRAWALGNLGNVAMMRGLYQEARDRLHESLEIVRSLHDRVGEANALGNLGLVAFLTEHHDEARQLYEQSLAVRESIGDRQGTGWLLACMGDLEASTGNLDAALLTWQRALDVQREAGDRLNEMRMLLKLGDTARVDRRHDEAESWLREALLLATELEQPEAQLTAHLTLGHLNLDRHRPDAADRHYHEAARISSAYSDADQHRQVLDSVAGALRQYGFDDRARRFQATYRLADASGHGNVQNVEHHDVQAGDQGRHE